MRALRAWMLCGCVLSVVGCGNPIRELTKAAKDLIPNRGSDPAPVPVEATTRIALIANLYADAATAPAFDPARPEATSTFIVSSSVYAGDGRVLDLRLCFRKVEAFSWQWHALVTNAGVARVELGRGELTFGEDGALHDSRVVSALRLPREDGSLSAPIDLYLGSPASSDADGFDGVTSTAESSRVDSVEADGGPG